MIASRTPPVLEVIEENHNALLVDFFSPEAIANKIVAALQDPTAYAQLREYARHTVVDRYDLYSKCLPTQLGLLDTARRAQAPHAWSDNPGEPTEAPQAVGWRLGEILHQPAADARRSRQGAGKCSNAPDSPDGARVHGRPNRAARPATVPHRPRIQVVSGIEHAYLPYAAASAQRCRGDYAIGVMLA